MVDSERWGRSNWSLPHARDGPSASGAVTVRVMYAVAEGDADGLSSRGLRIFLKVEIGRLWRA